MEEHAHVSHVEVIFTCGGCSHVDGHSHVSHVEGTFTCGGGIHVCHMWRQHSHVEEHSCVSCVKVIFTCVGCSDVSHVEVQLPYNSCVKYLDSHLYSHIIDM